MSYKAINAFITDMLLCSDLHGTTTRFVPFYNSAPIPKYMAPNAINLQCTFDQGKSPNGRHCTPLVKLSVTQKNLENVTSLPDP